MLEETHSGFSRFIYTVRVVLAVNRLPSRSEPHEGEHYEDDGEGTSHAKGEREDKIGH